MEKYVRSLAAGSANPLEVFYFRMKLFLHFIEGRGDGKFRFHLFNVKGDWVKIWKMTKIERKKWENSITRSSLHLKGIQLKTLR